MEKIQSTILTIYYLKGYHLINTPFKYHLSYLNHNLEYKAPPYKTIPLFGTLVGGTS